VAHAWVTAEDARGRAREPGLVDAPLTQAARFTVYLVRFQLVNDGSQDVELEPAVQVAVGDAWMTLPAVDPVAGQPFYAASDEGRKFRVRTLGVPVGQLRLDPPAGIAPVSGVSSRGLNPIRDLRLPARSSTEVEFAIRATMDADWGTSYALRLSDNGIAVIGSDVSVTMGAKPDIKLTPDQQSGRNVKDPVPRYRLDPSIGMTDMSIAASTPARSAMYGLVGPLAGSSQFDSPHVTYTLADDACAACHSSHTAASSPVLRAAGAQSTGCFVCHDGTGSLADVKADWTSPGLPANDPAASAWYSHPATSASEASHVSDKTDEFGGVLNRHVACSDCHQPHLADATKPIHSVVGWTAAGAIKGASGVGVQNGPAGSSPTYSLKMSASFEYELCLKCHSGFTQLSPQDPARPSRWALDKGIEFNPANVSYHPVQAPGKNQTNAMSLSLSGTSPYKLWDFGTGDTVRCLHCHGDSAVASSASPPPADARLDNHAGPNRGILIANYRDRELKPQGQLYAAEDFALCYVCHAEEAMVDDSGDVRFDTNFNWHGFHANAIAYDGTGDTDIDAAGAGQGNATCAECHFRTHSTALATGGQSPAKGLVNFAPNVVPRNGTLSFVPATSSSLGTCTLTCHGKPHDGYVYLAAP
jgi:predicted CXXCH cytochrome family protein